ncbi:MAG: hypothetical protein ABII64_01045 [Elusimicrobiota bacterium]
MKSKLKIFLIIAAVMSVFHFLPAVKFILSDLAGGSVSKGFGVVWKGIGFFNAPFAGLSYYVQAHSNYLALTVSWLLWLAAGFAVYGVAAKKKIFAVVKNVFFSWLVFFTILVLLVFVKHPSPHLRTPDGFSKVNFHSHTYYSQDGVCSPGQNARFHGDSGFDASFITEHNTMSSCEKFSMLSGLPLILPGMQFNAENLSLLMLGDKKIGDADILPVKDKTIKEAVKWAHRKGLIVICPHWWKWGKPSWQELYDAGVDGFEIYNMNYRDFSDAERGELVKFCRENGLLMAGNTDWKGFGWAADVWNVIDVPRAELTPGVLKEYLKKRGPVKVIAYRQSSSTGLLRRVFEPFVGVYLLLAGIGVKQLISWLFWITLGIALSSKKYLVKAVLAMVFLYILFLDFGFLLAYFGSSGRNDALGEIVLPALGLVTAGWAAILLPMLKKGKTPA